MVKRLVILLAGAAGALALQRKLRDQRAEQDLWAEATDDVRSSQGSDRSG